MKRTLEYIFEGFYRDPLRDQRIPIQIYLQDHCRKELGQLRNLGLIEDYEREIDGEVQNCVQLTTLGEIYCHNKFYIENPFARGTPQFNQNQSLYRYQRAGVQWLLEKNAKISDNMIAYALLGDDMGMGKTRQIIAYISSRLNNGVNYDYKFLVVVPAILKTQWIKKIRLVVNNIRLYVFEEKNSSLEEFWNNLKKFDVVLISYAKLRMHYKAIFSYIEWDAVILDEADKIKNTSSRNLQAAINLLARFRIAITGTPIRLEIGDLRGIFMFLTGYPKFENNISRQIQDATRDHVSKVMGPQRQDSVSNSELCLLQFANKHILRRTIHDPNFPIAMPAFNPNHTVLTLSQVPIAVRNNDSQETIYNEEDEKFEANPLENTYILEMICSHPLFYEYISGLKILTYNNTQQTITDNKTNQQVPVNEIIKQCNKLEATINIVRLMLANPADKVVIFVHWLPTGFLLSKLLTYLLPNQIVKFLHGDTPDDKREEMIDNFQTKRNDRILVANIDTAGVGLDLQVANRVIIYDKRWSYAEILQAVRRVYRVGQNRAVYAYYFTTEDTIEERMEQKMQKKKVLLDLVIVDPI
ncbi:MAG: hypothetical protein GF364_12170 [Candidatus Lokiarchaeota archaeon]|nr:hypothetical protein [Candidatus Lokiarchaeota archaeon]